MNLPKRPPEDLARDLRARAALLGGEPFEAPATAAMMREAADMIDALRSNRSLDPVTTMPAGTATGRSDATARTGPEPAGRSGGSDGKSNT